MKEPNTWMSLSEVVQKLNEYEKGDEYQKATEDAVFYLTSYQTSFDLFRNQMSIQKHTFHSYVNLLDDKDREIDRLNQKILQGSDSLTTVLMEGKAPTAPPYKELTDEEIHKLANKHLQTQDQDGKKIVVGLEDFAREILKKASEK